MIVVFICAAFEFCMSVVVQVSKRQKQPVAAYVFIPVFVAYVARRLILRHDIE